MTENPLEITDGRSEKYYMRTTFPEHEHYIYAIPVLDYWSTDDRVLFIKFQARGQNHQVVIEYRHEVSPLGATDTEDHLKVFFVRRLLFVLDNLQRKTVLAYCVQSNADIDTELSQLTIDYGRMLTDKAENGMFAIHRITGLEYSMICGDKHLMRIPDIPAYDHVVFAHLHVYQAAAPPAEIGAWEGIAEFYWDNTLKDEKTIYGSLPSASDIASSLMRVAPRQFGGE